MLGHRVHPDKGHKRLSEVLLEEHIFIGGRPPEGEEAMACLATPAQGGEDDNAALKSFYSHIHAECKKGRPRAALCFSGGGIRSATFNLGLLQRIIELGLLDKFDFLSTVSGGGYLGSWLSAWIHRAPGGRAGVIEALNRISPKALAGGSGGAGEPPLCPEPPQLEHLRSYSRFLNPTAGALSVDSWTLATIYFRNLTLNWLVLGPLLLAVLLIPTLCVAVATWRMDDMVTQTLLPLVAVLAAAWSFAYAGIHQPSAQARSKPDDSDVATPWRKAPGGQRHFLIWCFTPLLFSMSLLTLYWEWIGRRDGVPINQLVAFGILLGVSGWTCAAWVADDLGKLFELPLVVAAGCCLGVSLWFSEMLLQWIAPHLYSSPEIAGLHHALLVCLTGPLILISLSAAGTLYIGLISRLRATWDWDIDREWWARFGGWVLIATASWLAGSALVLLGPLLLLGAGIWTKVLISSAGGLSGVISLALGYGSTTTATTDTSAAGNGKSSVRPTNIAVKILPQLFIAFMIVCGSLLTIWVADSFASIPLCTDVNTYLQTFTRPRFIPVFGLMASLVLLGYLASRLINLNKFSLHSVYRDRLIRTFLGASRSPASRPDPFTGFDRNDNVAMHRLCPALLRDDERIGDALIHELAQFPQRSDAGPSPLSWLSSILSRTTRRALTRNGGNALEAAQALLIDDLNRIILGRDLANEDAFKDAALKLHGDARSTPDVRLRNRRLLEAAFGDQFPVLQSCRLDAARPMHIVNIALNLVHTSSIAWQERKAESFTVSCLHSGSWKIGYRGSREYAGSRKLHSGGISLGTAMTISGAAVSPNMGYHTSKPLAFLMTLFNVRLGAWLGNPGSDGQATFDKPCPESGITPLVAEALGLTDEHHKYVYLSDGGHFENLGIYEMVRRRCHWIVVGDGGADPDGNFDDLGNAIRKIRIDMGVSITFLNDIRVTTIDCPEPKDARYCAVAQIHYKGVDGADAEDGYLLYIKPAVHRINEPADVYNYAKVSPPFPHQSTLNQFFGESQFESYRALGYHIARQLCDAPAALKGLPEFFDGACTYLKIKAVHLSNGSPQSAPPQKGNLVMTQNNPRQAGSQSPTWTLESLDVTPQQELNDVFANSVHADAPRPAGPMPDGDAVGIAVIGSTPFWRRLLARFVHQSAWQGKVFKRQDEDNATLVNKISALGLKEIHARVYRGPSRLDSKECIVLDYSKTSLLARKIRDEIREVSPGVYLGVVYWGESNKPLIDFALSFNGAKS